MLHIKYCIYEPSLLELLLQILTTYQTLIFFNRVHQISFLIIFLIISTFVSQHTICYIESTYLMNSSKKSFLCSAWVSHFFDFATITSYVSQIFSDANGNGAKLQYHSCQSVSSQYTTTITNQQTDSALFFKIKFLQYKVKLCLQNQQLSMVHVGYRHLIQVAGW